VVRAPSIGKCTHLLLLGLGFFDEIIQYFPFRYLDFLQHALARTSLVVMHLAITLLLAALMELCWCMIKGSCRWKNFWDRFLNFLRQKLALFDVLQCTESSNCLLQRPLLSLDAHIRIVNRYKRVHTVCTEFTPDIFLFWRFVTCCRMHPFSHVFSTESSSIDTVRLGQSCQRLFFYQKPDLSKCPLSCLLLLIISTAIFIFVSRSLLWTNSSCLVGIVSHLVVKMVRGAYTRVMKALCKDTFLHRQQNWYSKYCLSFYTSFRRHCSVVAHGTPVRRFVLWPQWWPCHYATHSAHERCERRQVSAWL
jgi:hypothetical protein